MAAVPLRLRVTIVTAHGEVPILAPAQSSDRVADLLDRFVREFGLTGGAAAWQLIFTDRTLPHNRTLREVVPSALDPVPLTLRPVAAGAAVSAPSTHGSTAGLAIPSSAANPVPEPSAAPTQELDAVPTPVNRPSAIELKRTHTRPATVRYYSRMNPERVYPIQVVLSRQDIETALHRHVQERITLAPTLTVDAPVEIEPVFPGCAVDPPRLVTRIGPNDERFEFHVVPHVLGPVTGARLRIRQDYATLAEVELEARVAQRTMVLVVGLLALLLPLLSAALGHLRVDFTPKEGWDVYVGVLNFVFGELTPVMLTVILAGATGVLFWFTRPQTREVQWDLSKPANKSRGS
jgi:hypothetical protein